MNRLAKTCVYTLQTTLYSTILAARFTTIVTTIVATIFATTFATASYAAEPVSIQFKRDITVGKKTYSHYVVTCSNNVKKDISAWNNRKFWCEGKGTRYSCKKKKMSTARKVCNSN